MNGHDVIQAFGGLGPTSEIVGSDRRAVEQWKRIGVPAKYWHKLVEAARERNIEGVTFAALEQTHAVAPKRLARSGDPQVAA